MVALAHRVLDAARRPPLKDGSPDHGVTTKAPNVRRVVVEGETAKEWLRLRVDPHLHKVFSWKRIKL